MADLDVVFLTNHYLAGVGGGVFATSAYANAVSELYDGRLLLIYPQKVDDDVPSFVNSAVHKIGCVDRRSALQKLYGYATGRLTRFTEKILDECLANAPNARVAVLDGSLVGGAFAEYFRRLGIRVITLHHNVESEYHLDSRTPVSLWGLCGHYINQSERNAAVLSDLNLTITSDDAQALKRLYPNSSLMSSLGVFEFKKNDDFVLPPVSGSDSVVCAITGSMGSYQTHDGIKYFLHELLPSIVSEASQVKFIIAGRSPGKELYDLSRGCSNVEIVANPVDMQDVINQADMYLCPTRLGGGLKLRVMDGLRSGLPVLAHKVSARGYQQIVERGYLQPFESVDQFAIGFREMLKNVRAGRYSRLDIRKAYDETFSFEQGVVRLREKLNDAGLL